MRSMKRSSSRCGSVIPSRFISARQSGHRSHCDMSTSSPPTWMYSEGNSSHSSPRMSPSSA